MSFFNFFAHCYDKLHYNAITDPYSLARSGGFKRHYTHETVCPLFPARPFVTTVQMPFRHSTSLIFCCFSSRRKNPILWIASFFSIIITVFMRATFSAIFLNAASLACRNGFIRFRNTASISHYAALNADISTNRSIPRPTPMRYLTKPERLLNTPQATLPSGRRFCPGNPSDVFF